MNSVQSSAQLTKTPLKSTGTAHSSPLPTTAKKNLAKSGNGAGASSSFEANSFSG